MTLGQKDPGPMAWGDRFPEEPGSTKHRWWPWKERSHRRPASVAAPDSGATTHAGEPAEKRARRAGIRRHPLVAVVVGVVWAAVMQVRLFLGGPVGLAGFGENLPCRLGLANFRNPALVGWEHVQPIWTSHAWTGETCPPEFSTALLTQAAGRWLTPLLGYPGALDLRALGVLFALLVGVVCGLLVAVTPGRPLFRAGFASAVGLLYADAGFAGYLVSPYAEPTALVAAGFLVVALLLLWERPTAPRVLATAVPALLLVGARPEYVTFVPVIGFALLWVRGRRVVALMVATWIAGLGVFHTATEARFDDRGAVFETILYDDPTAAADLTSLGLDPELAPAAGLPREHPTWAALADRYHRTAHPSPLRVAGFYATHPWHAVRTVGWGFQGVAGLRPHYLGSYPEGAGKPEGEQEHRVAVYSTIWEVFRKGPLLVLVLWIATAGAGYLVVRRRSLTPSEKTMGRLAAILPLAALAQFAVVVLVHGRVETVRHMAMTSWLTAMCVPVMAAAVALVLTRLRPVPRWQHRH
ncbi:hypothetical protein FDA94_02915 [Herbidospora galbida]|uniref:Glycosyltransferase RgtA/B/C/D-like domain-containing protein n=1 Tax=Herbidospora galbida TaxID=2575442 RepID=A0A4U3MPQ8_9ACTN|nr:hypothetical protein [Herbidospora galbida]TKK90734.1 hypothetical protein FDA94_02915 [Herbidospora galbida]